MSKLQLFSKSDISEYANFRNGEIKLAERIQLLDENSSWVAQLKQQDSKYVILGLPEDIGVKANMGRPGTATAWPNFLQSFLNIQHNRYCKGHWITLLGAFDFSEEMQLASQLDATLKDDRKKLYDLVSRIDKEVAHCVSQIVTAGKIPILIGGGHNNAYGNIKGMALAKGKSVNVINFDAHTDFRPLEGRHSGNGFSYAMEEGFLKNYFIFGLHESYTSKGVFNEIKKLSEKVKYNSYEQMCIRGEKSFETELINAQKHIEQTVFGLEVDLDSIPLVASSAITPSGFSVEQLRQFIHHFARLRNVGYLHICEGAPILDSDKNPNLVGKLIAYLVTDFVKSNIDKN